MGWGIKKVKGDTGEGKQKWHLSRARRHAEDPAEEGHAVQAYVMDGK